MRQGKIFAPEKISMGVVVENAECLGRAAREAPGSAHPAKRRRGRQDRDAHVCLSTLCEEQKTNRNVVAGSLWSEVPALLTSPFC